MKGKLTVGALVAALLMSGLLVGISHGGSAPITEPTKLVLSTRSNADGARVRTFPLRDFEGIGGGQVTIKLLPLYDRDGNRVGRQRISCLTAGKNWMCDIYFKINEGPNTEKGILVSMAFKPLNDPDHIIHSIVGGTGAYRGVGGYAIQNGQQGLVRFKLYVTP